MKKLLLLLLLLPLALRAQVTEDFADGDFSQNPEWSGTTERFVVNDKHQLQLNGEGEGSAWLSLPIIEYETMEWHFWIKEGFAPSGNNYSNVWLCADNADLTQVTQGYFLRFGEAGSNDAITLLRKDAEGEQEVCRGREGAIAASFAVSVKVVCDPEGYWTIQTCYDGSGVYDTEAEGSDDSYARNGYFGIFSKYTSSNAKKVYLDDIYIGPDNVIPEIVDHAEPGDILINEILFNPIAPGVDYVELYNNSDKDLDLSKLLLGVIKSSFPNPPDTTLKEISSVSQPFPPQTYVLLSSNSEIVGMQYDCPTDNYVEMASFPSYINAGATAILMDKEGVMIDQMVYLEKMHHPLLKVTKGVALERVSFDQPSMEADNWHSAAESAHFGTPGQPNSMKQDNGFSEDEIAISPEIFSPDGDGYDDACFINYRFDEAGYTMNIYIFNVAGQQIRHLAKGELVGQEGSVMWNGLDENGNRIPVGVYIIVTEVFNTKGRVKQMKNAVVVGTR